MNVKVWVTHTSNDSPAGGEIKKKGICPCQVRVIDPLTPSVSTQTGTQEEFKYFFYRPQ
jgi:hypothetical protein